MAKLQRKSPLPHPLTMENTAYPLEYTFPLNHYIASNPFHCSTHIAIAVQF